MVDFWGKDRLILTKYFTLALLLSLPLFSCGQTGSSKESAVANFSELVQQFVQGYRELELPGLRIAYVENLAAILPPDQVAEQQAFFAGYSKRLSAIEPDKLPAKELLEYRQLIYEIELNQHRLALEERWLKEAPEDYPENHLFALPHGKEWYRYWLKRWNDLSVEPDALYTFGVQEIEQVMANMRAIRQRSGMDSTAFEAQLQQPIYFYQSAGEVRAASEAIHQRLTTPLAKLFPAIDQIPPLDIQRGEVSLKVQTPGFYRNNTFFYTFFERPFERRQLGWLYTHEGLPGHHYERSYTNLLEDRSELTQIFHYPVYHEGWAAYIEEIGGEFGAYQNDIDWFGKWEWDLIRSLRVPMDIGLNYYGWTDEEALAFWQKYLPEKDDIAQREINRMRHWPAQVITYKYGAEKILAWQKAAAKKTDFNWKDFHSEVLSRGPLPLSILDDYFSE